MKLLNFLTANAETSTWDEFSTWAGNGFNALLIILLGVLAVIILAYAIAKVGKHMNVVTLPTMLMFGSVAILTGEVATDQTGWEKLVEFAGSNFNGLMVILLGVVVVCIGVPFILRIIKKLM